MIDSGSEFSWIDSSGGASRGEARRTSDQGGAPAKSTAPTRSATPAKRAAAPARRTAGRVTRSSGPAMRTAAPTTIARRRASPRMHHCNDLYNIPLPFTVPLPSQADYCFLAAASLSPALLVIHAPLLFLLCLLCLLLANRNDNVLLQLKYDILSSKSKKIHAPNFPVPYNPSRSL